MPAAAVHCPTRATESTSLRRALDTVIGGTRHGASAGTISGNGVNGVLIDGTGAPADTPLYLKADDNTNNSTSETNPDRIPGSATLVGGVTYGTGVTGEAFQFSDTAESRVVVPPDNANNLAATALTPFGLTGSGQPSRARRPTRHRLTRFFGDANYGLYAELERRARLRVYSRVPH